MTATAGADGVARIYRGDQLIATVRGHGAAIEQVAFVDGGKALLTSDASGFTQVTRLDSLASHGLFDLDAIVAAGNKGVWQPLRDAAVSMADDVTGTDPWSIAEILIFAAAALLGARALQRYGTDPARRYLRGVAQYFVEAGRRAGAYLSVRGLANWLVAGGIVVAAVVLTPFVDPYLDLQYRYDQLSSVFVPPPSGPRFSRVIYVDDATYRQIGGRVPFDRNYLARILSALDAYDVQLIALDFDLDAMSPDENVKIGDYSQIGPYRSETDNLMREIAAVAHRRKIVLGKELFADFEHSAVKALSAVYQPYGICAKPLPDGGWWNPGATSFPLSADATANISCGYLNLPQDIRVLPMPLAAGGDTPIDSFSLAIARAVAPGAVSGIVHESTDLVVSYGIGSALSQSNAITTEQLLNGDRSAMRHLFVHQTVIVGGHWRMSSDEPASFVDMHATPVGLLSGAAIHQNYVESILDERFYRASGNSAWLALAAAIAFAFLFAVSSTLWRRAVIVGASLVGLLALQWLAFTLFQLYFNALLPTLALGLYSIANAFIARRRERIGPLKAQATQPAQP